MHRHSKTVVLFSLLSISAALGAGNGAATRSSSDAIHYASPAHSSSQVRVNGIASRGGDRKLPNLFVLTPEHVGLTVQEQPTLYWFLSEATETKLKVTITKDGDDEPLLESMLPALKGIGRLSLAEKHVKLEPDVQYQVTFALMPNAKNHSEDLCAVGMIRRVKPPQDLVAKLVLRADPLDRAISYAKGGIWYDALAVISDEIDVKDASTEKVSSMRRQRAALLEQVSLPDVANFDLAAGEKG